MVKGIIGKKVGMTQLFDENGKVIPVTVIEAGPCTVVQKKTVESDGYQAVQLGFGEVSAKKVNKAAAGHFLQGQGLPGRHQALRPAPPAREPRHRPRRTARRFQRLDLDPEPRLPRQAPARPHGLCAGHRAEPDGRQG